VKPGGQDLAPEHGIDALLNQWRAFGEGWVLLDMLVVLTLALRARGGDRVPPRDAAADVEPRATSSSPRPFLMYSMVAAIVALIVEVQPAMAFVIFGIGGLLRFRTDGRRRQGDRPRDPGDRGRPVLRPQDLHRRDPGHGDRLDA
jgi:hypothetical protein